MSRISTAKVPESGLAETEPYSSKDRIAGGKKFVGATASELDGPDHSVTRVTRCRRLSVAAARTLRGAGATVEDRAFVLLLAASHIVLARCHMGTTPSVELPWEAALLETAMPLEATAAQWLEHVRSVAEKAKNGQETQAEH